MPSLFRFLFLCAVLVGIVYGVMFALVIYVEPVDRELTVRVPTEKLNR
ncbi:histidine kinase [Hoeflea sp.]|nr:histidine kinase [Hoeflea sp.]MBC7284286.1 histidine kinase [Hoeflea sp.]